MQKIFLLVKSHLTRTGLSVGCNYLVCCSSTQAAKHKLFQICQMMPINIKRLSKCESYNFSKACSKLWKLLRFYSNVYRALCMYILTNVTFCVLIYISQLLGSYFFTFLTSFISVSIRIIWFTSILVISCTSAFALSINRFPGEYSINATFVTK